MTWRAPCPSAACGAHRQGRRHFCEKLVKVLALVLGHVVADVRHAGVDALLALKKEVGKGGRECQYGRRKKQAQEVLGWQNTGKNRCGKRERERKATKGCSTRAGGSASLRMGRRGPRARRLCIAISTELARSATVFERQRGRAIGGGLRARKNRGKMEHTKGGKEKEKEKEKQKLQGTAQLHAAALTLTVSLKGRLRTLGWRRACHVSTLRPASLTQSTRLCCPAPTPIIWPPTA